MGADTGEVLAAPTVGTHSFQHAREVPLPVWIRPSVGQVTDAICADPDMSRTVCLGTMSYRRRDSRIALLSIFGVYVKFLEIIGVD